MKRLIVILVVCVAQVNCATNSKTRWALMGASAPIGGAVGYASAPDNEKKEAHALLWASIFALGAAIVGNYFYSDDDKLKELQAENDKLKDIPKFEVISEGEGRFVSPNHKEQNAKYKIKKIDVWVNDGPDTKYHQDLKLERIVLPTNKAKVQ